MVAVGDTVTVDQPMVSMETAKAVVEVPSPYAGKIAVLYYLAMLAGVATVGSAIHWMGKTYGANQPMGQCIVPGTKEGWFNPLVR